MATVVGTLTPLKSFGARSHVVSWTPLLNGDVGDQAEFPGASFRTAQITGTFGTGGTIQIQGSNDGTNWVVLTDPQGNAITKTAAGIEIVEEVTRYIRPAVTAGDGTTSLTVTLLLRSTTV